MADTLTPENRSRLMARVKQKNTGPEILVRQVLHLYGFRFRLHRKDLPGCPDIVLPKYRTAVFVHGCFWHQHGGCAKAKRPATRVEWWAAKLEKNIARDVQVLLSITQLGWRPVVIWECETRDRTALAECIEKRILKKKTYD